MKEWGLLVAVITVFWCWVGRFHAPTYWFYLSRDKRRAMRLAVRYARECLGLEIDWSGCFTKRIDGEKYFVFLQHKCIARPESHSVFVVWRGSDRIDDLGVWTFHWGLFWPSQPIAAYEQCRSMGVQWPVGTAEWLEWSKQLEKKQH